jgi:Domain of unknown function (DUF4173)
MPMPDPSDATQGTNSMAKEVPLRTIEASLRFYNSRGRMAVLCASISCYLLCYHNLGVNLAIYSAVVAITVFFSKPFRHRLASLFAAASILFLAILAQIEDANVLSLLMGILALASFTLTVTDATLPLEKRHWKRMAQLLFAGPLKLIPEGFRWLTYYADNRRNGLHSGAIVRVGLPLVLTAGFLWLFDTANPLIHVWIAKIDLQFILDRLTPYSITFWFWMFATAWSGLTLRRSVQRRAKMSITPPVRSRPDRFVRLFDVQVVLRSLWLFNLLFAIETTLDLTYLWGGVGLPDGLSHATYAHQGAYPLVATALLAALFVLIAMRENGPADQSKLVRPLVLVWVVQNIMLVISSILRLNLYVSVYSMTYWRVAAFVWMGMVALGLVFILVRILGRFSSTWLIQVNATMLALVLYVCSLTNFADWIADYNVEHSLENHSTGYLLDVEYLQELGPDAIPALDKFIALPGINPNAALEAREGLANDELQKDAEWQSWTFRQWRLQNYLRLHPVPQIYEQTLPTGRDN